MGKLALHEQECHCKNQGNNTACCLKCRRIDTAHASIQGIPEVPASYRCSRVETKRPAWLLRERVLLALLALLHPFLQGCRRDPYRSAKTNHRQSLLCDQF